MNYRFCQQIISAGTYPVACGGVVDLSARACNLNFRLQMGLKDQTLIPERSDVEVLMDSPVLPGNDLSQVTGE